MLHRLPIDFAYLVAHMQRGLSVYHAAVHDACHNAASILGHFQRDALRMQQKAGQFSKAKGKPLLFVTYHRLVGILLELHKTHTCHMLQLTALDIVQLVAIEIRHHGRRCDTQRLLAIDIPCDNVVCVQQRLQGGRNETEKERESGGQPKNRQLELRNASRNYGQQLSCPSYYYDAG